jgi:hypothetical protein
MTAPPLRTRGLGLLLAAAIAGCAGGASQVPEAQPTTLPTPTAAPTQGPSVAATSETPPAPSLAPDAVLLAGTHVALVPPHGFVESTSFVGFEHESGASILVAELPASYTELITGMTDARFEEQGITVSERQAVIVGGREATLIEGTQEALGATFGKVLLLTGTDTLTAFVTGNYPIDREAIGEDIRAAELSLSFDPNRSVDPQAALNFTITPVAPLKFAGVVNNGGLYNTSGLLPAANPGEPSLIVAPSFGLPVVGDPIAFSRALLDNMRSIRDVAVESAMETTIAGRPAVVTVGTAESTTRDVEIVVYQVVLGGADDYVAFVGLCEPDQRATFFDVFAETIGTYAPKR